MSSIIGRVAESHSDRFVVNTTPRLLSEFPLGGLVYASYGETRAIGIVAHSSSKGDDLLNLVAMRMASPEVEIDQLDNRDGIITLITCIVVGSTQEHSVDEPISMLPSTPPVLLSPVMSLGDSDTRRLCGDTRYLDTILYAPSGIIPIPTAQLLGKHFHYLKRIGVQVGDHISHIFSKVVDYDTAHQFAHFIDVSGRY